MTKRFKSVSFISLNINDMSNLKVGDVVRDKTLIFPDDSPYMLKEINPNGNCTIKRVSPIGEHYWANIVDISNIELYNGTSSLIT